MGKITIKHYLNTNLKPYMVRGEKYFTVYMLVTVNRKTTKIPSHEFGELQTETDFEQLLTTPELQIEVKTVENIISNQLSIFNGDFDTQLFSAYYNLLPNYYAGEVGYIGVLSDLNTYEGKYSQRGWSLYDWFNPEIESEIIKSLNDPNHFRDAKALSKNINDLRQSILFGFFEILRYIAPSVAKYRDLSRKYEQTWLIAEDRALFLLFPNK